MYARLKEQSAGCGSDLVSFLQLLVRTQSFSFGEEAAAGVVQDLLEDLNYDLVFRDEVGNVIGLLAGTDEGPAVLLNAPLDTRRPGGADAAAGDLFTARVEHGRLQGLGSAACKGGLAAQIFAAHVLDRSLLPLSGTVVVAATVAQHEGNGAGLRHLMTETLPKLGITAGLAILGEPTGLAVCGGCDGRADVDVTISGKEETNVRKAAAAVYDALSSTIEGDPLARLAGRAPADGAGEREELFRFRCRVRMGEEAADRVGLVKQLAQAAAESFGGVTIDTRVHAERRRFYTGRPVEFLCWSNPWSTDTSIPLVERALGALSAAGWPDASARPVRSDDIRSRSAGSLLADGFHVPTLCFGPGDEDQAHSTEESVEIAKLVDAVFATAVLVHGAIGASVSALRPAGRAPSGRDAAPNMRSGG
jgi:acetylornithine deacetylase/succinyl-diaminopimelate desuccinylase-like protein